MNREDDSCGNTDRQQRPTQPEIVSKLRWDDVRCYVVLNQRLFSAYRVNELIGRPGKNGHLKLKHRRGLYLTLCWLYQARKLRLDRMDLWDLRWLALRATVRTVIKDYKQRRLPDCPCYLVMNAIQRIEVGEVL